MLIEARDIGKIETHSFRSEGLDMSKRAVVAVVVVGGIGVAIWTGVWETAANWAKLVIKRDFGRNLPAGYVDQTTPPASEESSGDQPTS